MDVKFVDLKLAYSDLDEEIMTAIKDVIESRNYILGDALSDFEGAFAKYNNTKFCVGVSNGLDALTIALKAAGIQAGDEVIVSSNTFIATWLSIKKIGAIPVPVDSCWLTQNLKIDELAEKLTRKTKAIVPVHIYGNLCDMEKISKFAKKWDLVVIEDAAQAHGARRNGINVGTFSDAAVFSFYPTKNLGAYGDAGAIITNKIEIDEKIRLIRNYGSRKKYYHEIDGGNCRLDEIQARVLLVKLNSLEEQNGFRRKIAEFYLNNINPRYYTLPQNEKNSMPSWHLFTIRNRDRDTIIKELENHQIEYGIHYPIPPHMQKCFVGCKPKLHLPITEKISKSTLSIPIYPNMPMAHAEKVVRILNSIKI